MLLGKDFYIEKVECFLRLCEFMTFLRALCNLKPALLEAERDQQHTTTMVVGGHFNPRKRKVHRRLVLGPQEYVWITTRAFQIFKVQRDALN